MERRLEIITPSLRFQNAPEEDINIKVKLGDGLNQKNKNQKGFTLSQYEQYLQERAESDKYRIYGSINFLSPITYKPQNLGTIKDLFSKTYNENRFEFNNLFDIYLVRDYELGSKTGGTNNVDKLEIISNKASYNIYNAAISRNLFGEQVFNFNFSFYYNSFDFFNFYLLFARKDEEYQKGEIISGYTYDVSGNTISGETDNYSFTLTGTSETINYKYERLYKIPVKELRVDNIIERIEFPFTNGCHYVYNNIIMVMKPDQVTKENFYDKFNYELREVESYNQEIDDGC